MGNYSETVGLKSQLPSSFVEALQDFSKSVIGAKEIDGVDLERMKEEGDFPMAFFIANVTIERLLADLRDSYPSKCPVVKPYGDKSKNEIEKILEIIRNTK
jgi:hypothetical protein